MRTLMAELLPEVEVLSLDDVGDHEFISDDASDDGRVRAAQNIGKAFDHLFQQRVGISGV